MDSARGHFSKPHWKGNGSLMDYDESSGLYKVPIEALSIIWGKDDRYWQRIKLGDEDKRDTGFEDGFVLLQVNWIEVTGEAPFDFLKAGEYEILYVVKFRADAFGWHSAPIKFKIRSNRVMEEDKVAKIEEKVIKLEDYRAKEEEWHEISGGKFCKEDSVGPFKVVFGMLETETSWWKGGMVLAGIKIKPLATKDSSHKMKV